jgi:hypothetical protein
MVLGVIQPIIRGVYRSGLGTILMTEYHPGSENALARSDAKDARFRVTIPIEGGRSRRE